MYKYVGGKSKKSWACGIPWMTGIILGFYAMSQFN